MDNTLTQSTVLLYTLYGGALMGLLYDALRPLRCGWLTQVFCDMVFWLGCFFVSAFVLFRANAFSFRVYTLCGFALGFGIYYCTLGWFVRAFIKRCMHLFGALSEKILEWLT